LSMGTWVVTSSNRGSPERDRAGLAATACFIAYRRGNRAVFLYGFAKSERENIDKDELATLQDIAAGWLTANDAKLARAIADGFVQEVDNDQR
jgi:hypothetical protein